MVYALIVAVGYMNVMITEHWSAYALAAIGATATWCLFHTYNSLVVLYNEKLVRLAIMGQQQSQEKQTSTTQVQSHAPVLTGRAAAKTTVKPSEQSSTERANERYVVALKLIEKEKAIGKARDIAWRALEYDYLETKRLEYQTKEIGSES
jgi:hypothetical protein